MMRRFILGAMMALGFLGMGASVEALGLPVGDVAPDFEVMNYQGAVVKLSEEIKKGPLVLIFYRGGWCFYCNRQLKSFQEALPDIEALGARLIAVSVDQKAKVGESVMQEGWGFEVIPNPQADLLELYNVVYHVPDETEDLYREKYQINLEAASGRGDHLIAVPATFVIDQKGFIIFAYVNEDYKIRTQPNEVLQILQGLTANK